MRFSKTARISNRPIKSHGVHHPNDLTFLSRLRNALFRSSKSGWTSLSLIERNDLDLMINFLNKANSGISINNVVYRKLTQIYRSDASEFGIGGYNLVSGRAWRFELPFDCRLKTSLNSLEFIACMITIWVNICSAEIKSEDCILNSTSAFSWLRKSNFVDELSMQVQLTMARQLANLALDHDCCLYSQWFTGEFNTVADCLSRDFHSNDSSLTLLLKSCVPHQIPFGFSLYPLPTEIVSWLTCLLQKQPFKEVW
jgi:hypothetical protein